MNIIAKTIRSAFRTRTKRNAVIDYLNESVSIIDLERREREIESGKFKKPHYLF